MGLSPAASKEICMETRKAFQVVDDAEKPIEFAELKKGMRFKLYESINDGRIFEAASDAYKNENNIDIVNVEGAV